MESLWRAAAIAAMVELAACDGAESPDLGIPDMAYDVGFADAGMVDMGDPPALEMGSADIGVDLGPVGCLNESAGTACDDGDDRTYDDACSGGVCAGLSCVCEEGACCSNGCTFDARAVVCAVTGVVATNCDDSSEPRTCGYSAITLVRGIRRCTGDSPVCGGSVIETSRETQDCPSMMACSPSLDIPGDGACAVCTD